MATVVCEKHGLRYDAESPSGCVICRREAAVASGEGKAAPPTRPMAVASSPDGLALPLLVAASIWLVSAFVLFTAHQQIAASYVFQQAELERAAGAEIENAPIAPSDQVVDPNSLGAQTDTAIDELQALRGEETQPPSGRGAPPLIPSSEQLSPPPQPSAESEEPSTEPVVIETESSGGAPPPQP